MSLLATGAAFLLLLAVHRPSASGGPAAAARAVAIGASMLIGALVVPPLMPTVVAGSVLPGGGVAGLSAGINPVLDLGDDLRRPSPVTVLRYTNDSTGGQYLTLAHLDEFTGQNVQPVDDGRGGLDRADRAAGVVGRRGGAHGRVDAYRPGGLAVPAGCPCQARSPVRAVSRASVAHRTGRRYGARASGVLRDGCLHGCRGLRRQPLRSSSRAASVRPARSRRFPRVCQLDPRLAGRTRSNGRRAARRRIPTRRAGRPAALPSLRLSPLP